MTERERFRNITSMQLAELSLRISMKDFEHHEIFKFADYWWWYDDDFEMISDPHETETEARIELSRWQEYLNDPSRFSEDDFIIYEVYVDSDGSYRLPFLDEDWDELM